MKSSVKVFLAYLFGAMFLFSVRSLVPVLSGKWNIADSGEYRMLCLLFLPGTGMTVLLFSLLKRKDKGIRDIADLIREENVNPYAVAVPGKFSGACYQPVRFVTVLGITGVFCLFRVLLRDGSLSRANLPGVYDASALFWKSIWLVAVCPIAEGILHRGLLQRNLMKFGTVYAVLLSAVTLFFFRFGAASERGLILYAVFYGILAARYGLGSSLRAEMIHMFFYVLPTVLPLGFVFKNGGAVLTLSDFLDGAAFLGTGIFMAVLGIRLVIRVLKLFFSKKPVILFSGRIVRLRADGTMTILFLAGFYLLQEAVEYLIIRMVP